MKRSTDTAGIPLLTPPVDARGLLLQRSRVFYRHKHLLAIEGLEPPAISQLLDLAVFPGTQGGPLEHIIAAKAVAFGEILNEDFKSYGQQVIVNAQAMAKSFVAKGYDLISEGTDNHLMLIDLRNKNLTGKKAQETLDKAHITLNKNAVPFDDKSPFVTSGIRIGVPAVTTRGMNEAHMETVVAFIDAILSDIDNEATVNKVKGDVHAFMQQFVLYPELG